MRWRRDRNVQAERHSKMRRLVRICARAVLWLMLICVADAVLCALGAFEPRYPVGDPVLGIWLKQAGASGIVRLSILPELADDPVVGRYERNEDGFASSGTMGAFRAVSAGARIVSLGDSHTDLYYNFAHTHMGVLEAELVESWHADSRVLGAGHGFYSILQSWLLYQTRLGDLKPDAIVLNFYTGNDLYDLIRQDDRPYLVSLEGGGFEIHPPRWVAYVPNANRPLWSRSRVIYAVNCSLMRLGLEHLAAKTRAAWTAARAYGGDPLSSLHYLNDLRNSRDPELWYPGAAAAQALNQALFFHHFRGASDESLRRVRFVLSSMREAYPDCLLILSMIPSRCLAHGPREDAALDRVLARLPLTRAEVLRQEETLYREVATIGVESGWLIADPLASLTRAGDECYFSSDWHLAPVGSRIVGRAQAEVLRAALRDRTRDANGRS